MKIEFYLNDTGVKIKELWIQETAIPNIGEPIVLLLPEGSKRFIVKTREFHFTSTLDTVQVGLEE